jgi:hypothetical protein
VFSTGSDLLRATTCVRCRRHARLARLRERVVEIRPDGARRSRVGKRVAAAAGLKEVLLAGALASSADVAARATRGEGKRKDGRERGGYEQGEPHGGRV